MNRSPWFLGIDLGTGSCKSVVVNEKAEVLGFGTGHYSGADVQDRWQEQNPQDLVVAAIAAVQRAVRQAGAEPGGCAGLSLCGALHSVIALDRHGNPLTGAMTWADGRAAGQSMAVKALPTARRLYQETGCPVHGMYPLYKVIWLREERPETFRQAQRFVSAKEYVSYHLTGEYWIDYSLAAGSGFLNTYSLQWNPLSLDLAGIGEKQLSSLCSPLTVHDGLRPEVARQMGLPASVPVVLGSSDAVNSSLGAGAVSADQATCMVGTSGALRMISPRPVIDTKARSWCYAIDEAHWLVGGAINNGGVALSWFTEILNQALGRFADGKSLSFDDVLTLAGRARAGAGGLLCLPFLAGERSPNWNPNARALFFGMTLSHDVTHLCRALLEGIAFRLRTLQEMLLDMGLNPAQIVASGGFTKSDLWLQVVSDVLNRRIMVPVWGETSSLGAALWAMRSAGKAESLEALGGYVRMGGTRGPNLEDAAVYDRLYPFYVRLYQSLEDAFHEVAALQDDLNRAVTDPEESSQT